MATQKIQTPTGYHTVSYEKPEEGQWFTDQASMGLQRMVGGRKEVLDPYSVLGFDRQALVGGTASPDTMKQWRALGLQNAGDVWKAAYKK